MRCPLPIVPLPFGCEATTTNIVGYGDTIRQCSIRSSWVQNYHKWYCLRWVEARLARDFCLSAVQLLWLLSIQCSMTTRFKNFQYETILISISAATNRIVCKQYGLASVHGKATCTFGKTSWKTSVLMRLSVLVEPGKGSHFSIMRRESAKPSLKTRLFELRCD